MLRFDERFLDEIKARLRLSDVIGRTVKLRRQGREFVGLSPFNKEKSPSFFVNDDKGFYHDFSSGKHGDLISFVQEIERLSFPEAIERLAGEAGLALPSPDPRAAEAEQRRAGLQDWLDEAATWFEAQLRRPVGAAARAYLDKRQLPEAERARFRLGYAPANRTGLKDHLIAKGAKPAELVDAGLLIQPEDGNGSPYDRFRDRIIFPIADGRGRLVSFGGRALDPEARAKYLNGPETPLFSKSRTLYGLPEARRLLHTPAAAQAGSEPALVVVEGYFDVIACQRAGVAAVAPLGTALTEEQMAALWRLHPEPTVCFDSDKAGQRAAARVIERALPLLQPRRSLRFGSLAGSKDPDDVLREFGEAALREQLTTTRPFVEALYAFYEAALEPLTTPEKKTELKVALRRAAGAIADRDLSLAYQEALYARLRRREEIDRAQRRVDRYDRKLSRFYIPTTPRDETAAALRRLLAAPRPFVAALAQAVLVHPELVDDRMETITVQGFGDPELTELLTEVIRARVTYDALDSEGLTSHLVQRGFETRLAEVAWAAERSHAPFLVPDQTFEAVRAHWSQAYDALIRITALERAVADAKSDLEQDEDVTTFMTLKAQRDALKRSIMAGTYPTDTASNL